MKFLYPEFLWAMSAVSIPVIIHLFNFRRYKLIYFSNLRFLKNLQEQTQSQQKLKHLLILAARILSIIFLVMAFAQPYLPSVNQNKLTRQNGVSIFIDNSFSMTNQSNQGELIELAKNKAREIAYAYKESDLFQLLTNDFEGRHQRLVNRTDLLKLIDEVTVSPVSKKLSEVVARQKQALNKAPENNPTLFLLSDFQQSQTDLANLPKDTAYHISLIPLAPAVTSNLYIDSCWFKIPFVQPKVATELMVRIRNSGQEDITGNSVTLKINDIQKALSGFEVNANSYTDVPLTFTPETAGDNKAELAIQDNPVVFDDHLYFHFEVFDHASILHVYETTAGVYLPAVYASDPFFKVTSSIVTQINYGEIGKAQLVILDGLTSFSSGMQLELDKFIQNGGSVLIFPSATANMQAHSFASFVQYFSIPATSQITKTNEKIHQINTRSELFKSVFEKVPENTDLPSVTMYISLGATRIKNSTPLLTMRNGDIVLCDLKRGKGHLYVSGIALDKAWSSLPESWVMPAICLRTALSSRTQQNMYAQIGVDRVAEYPLREQEKENLYKLKNGQMEVIPEAMVANNRIRIYFNELIKEAGNYTLIGESGATGGLLSLNFNRNESVMQFIEGNNLNTYGNSNVTVLNEEGENMALTLSKQQQGTPFWKLCIVLVLVFLLIEILLLKFYKK
jgi:hypothetical protein